MATHTFRDQQIRLDDRFVLLGPDWLVLNAQQRQSITRKVRGETTRKSKFVWATLGWAENRKFEPDGSLRFSTRGQDGGAKGVTLDEITSIYRFNGMLGNEATVRERYINLDGVDFGFHPKTFGVDDLPMLRLTLFLNKGEGAIVFYLHSNRDDYDDADAEVVYIHPQPTADHNNERDRLDYLFPILPGPFMADGKDPKQLTLLDEKPGTSFVIKVLTFARYRKDSAALFKEGIRQINKNFQVGTDWVGYKKYKILKYNASTRSFQVVSKKSGIDWKAKTLILIHGTFKTVDVTYRDLIEHANKNLLDLFLENNVYEQILGFDHPTISRDIFDNARWLYDYIGSKSFSKPVSLLGTSRGGLLTRWLAADPTNEYFKVSDILNFSTASGVDYFTLGKHIGTVLTVLKRAGGPGALVITMLAQFSAEYFMKQPGCQQMTPGNDRLRRILSAHPKNLRYQGVAADWEKSLEPSFAKRLLSMMVGATANAVLGKENDWVVNTQNQQISPHSALPACTITSMHTRNYETGFAKKGSVPFDTHAYIYKFFSGMDQEG